MKITPITPINGKDTIVKNDLIKKDTIVDKRKGRNLRYRRNLANYSIEEVSSILNIDSRLIIELESGCPGDEEVLDRIHKLYDKSINSLFK